MVPPPTTPFRCILIDRAKSRTFALGSRKIGSKLLPCSPSGVGGGTIRSATWHYMNYAGKGEELYDMVNDPDQYVNVINNPEYSEILKVARVKYEQRMTEAQVLH